MKVAIFHNLPSGGAKRALYQSARLLGSRFQMEAYLPDTADESFCSLEKVVDRVHQFRTRWGMVQAVRGALACHISPLLLFARSFRFLGSIAETQKKIAHTINDSPCDLVLLEQDRFVFSPFLLRYLKKPHLYYCQQPLRASREAILERLQSERDARLAWLYRGLRHLANRTMARIDEENAACARFVLTNSYFTREFILRVYGCDAHVCYLGVDTSVFRPLSTARGDFVLSVGSIQPLKGFPFIVRALGAIPARHRPRLVIIANQSVVVERHYLLAQAASLRVDLTISDMVSDTELVQAYNMAQAVVYAPYLEPFGLVPLEAMACGTPVVAVREGGVRETVSDGETGILVERDESEFAAAIQSLCDNPGRRNAMGRRGVETVQSRWTAEQAADRLAERMQIALHRQANL